MIFTSQNSIKILFKTCILGMVLLFGTQTIYGQKKTTLILDADTGNEVDDLFAIVRVLIEPTWKVTALNATHWQTSHWAIPQSMENSHRLNQLLVGHLDMEIKTKRGGIARMFDWGDKAQHSAAAYEIIRQAKVLPTGEKLTIVALGALTNVASAIYIEPAIESKIKLFWLGSTYDFESGILSTTDFNCVMDIQAVHILFRSNVEMHVMPSNVASGMIFGFSETESHLRDIHPLGDFLVDRWFQHLDGGRKKRVIWDLALVEAMLHPEWAEKISIRTSKDYGDRLVHYYKSIDPKKMKADFFSQVVAYL